MRAHKRLRVIADLVCLKNGVVADIGADHGLLSKILIDEGRAKKIIATDISAPSLQKTRDLVEKNLLASQIECRVGDGLKPLLQNEVDLAIIAGMGGYEIIKILEQSKSLGIINYIFQPVQNAVQLRTYLQDNGYSIKKDFLICDKTKFYNTIYVSFCGKPEKLSYNEIEFGVDNLSNPTDDFKKYLLSYINTCNNICNKTSKNVQCENKLKNAKELYEELYGSKIGE